MIFVQLENIVDSSFPVNIMSLQITPDQMTIFLDVSVGLLRSEKNNRPGR